MRHLYLLFILLSLVAAAQEKPEGRYSIDADYFYGNIVPHSKAIYQLITSHPAGVMLSFNRKTFGEKRWEADYNYPDIGASFQYQDMKNRDLGDMYGLYGHYSFYFLQRNLMLRIGQGIAYNTNPYNRDTNFRNNAYGDDIMPTTYFMLNYRKHDLWQGLGVQAGFMFIHHSNASAKAPNTSTNTLAVNAGINYTFGRSQNNQYLPRVYDSVRFTQPVKYNFIFRGGANESSVIGSGRKPYFAASVYADKRWSRKSAFHLGADFFWPKYLKEYIRHKAIAFPEEKVDAGTDYKKAGVFIGHELFINRLSLETQAGCYVYSPYKSTGSLYQRVGLRYYFTDAVTGGFSLKTHGAVAEILEFSIGIRI